VFAGLIKGVMAQRRNGVRAQWRKGVMAQRRNGARAQWRKGEEIYYVLFKKCGVTES
jgi:hypothetical protein